MSGNILYLMSIPNEWQASGTWRKPQVFPPHQPATVSATFVIQRLTIYVDLFADFAPGDNTEHEEDDDEGGRHHFYEAKQQRNQKG